MCAVASAGDRRVAGSGAVKILDFGIARGDARGLTRPCEVVGTLNYLSPEQLAGAPVDHRTDIYSVGAVAYELVTGQMGFPGTVQTACSHVAGHEPGRQKLAG